MDNANISICQQFQKSVFHVLGLKVLSINQFDRKHSPLEFWCQNNKNSTYPPKFAIPMYYTLGINPNNIQVADSDADAQGWLKLCYTLYPVALICMTSSFLIIRLNRLILFMCHFSVLCMIFELILFVTCLKYNLDISAPIQNIYNLQAICICIINLFAVFYGFYNKANRLSPFRIVQNLRAQKNSLGWKKIYRQTSKNINLTFLAVGQEQVIVYWLEISIHHNTGIELENWKFSCFVLNMKINWEIKGIAKRFLDFNRKYAESNAFLTHNPILVTEVALKGIAYAFFPSSPHHLLEECI
ncbi:hypothetical protein AGLY_011430 [Aphis glycines]|uniref:Uncharacterized protein n=1 Tax=Aphis glycines TaxID=307491 RepID=A0A6G0TE08_APHGL|nr:hypothetical protein AGLY_011430 [Aphis glycines]